MAMNFKVFEDKQHAADYLEILLENNLTITQLPFWFPFKQGFCTCIR